MNTSSYTQKKTVEIILTLEVYDDFNHDDVDFHDLLQLEGGESGAVNVKDYSRFELIWILINIIFDLNSYQ